MANSERHGKAAKLPSRAASLQRMLEIERKQKVSETQNSIYMKMPKICIFP